MPSQLLNSTIRMPSGSTILSTAPCGWEGEEGEKDKVRNEETRAAAGRLKPYLKIWEVTFTQMLPYPSRPSHGGPGPACPREDATA